MKKTILSFLVFFFICSMVFAAGSQESSTQTAKTDGKTSISILRPGDQEKVAEFMEPAIAAFEEQNPEIDVEIVYESWGGWIQKYPTLFQAETQPDVIFWWDNKQNDSSAKPTLVNLKPYLDQELMDTLPADVWDLATIEDGKVYYVPSSVDIFMLMYNKDVFRKAGLDPNKPPKTWDELLDACEAITNKTSTPALGVPAKTGMETLQEFIAHFITQATGKSMLGMNNEVQFDNSAALDALEFVEKLWPHVQPSATDYTRGDLRPLVRDGEIGMILESAWAIPLFQAKYGENLDNSPVGVVTVPLPESGNKVSWAGTNGWIATREETAEASAKLINFIMKDENLFAHHKAYGSFPITEYELNQPFYQYDFWKNANEAIQNYKLIGMIGKNSSTPAAYYSNLEEVWQQFLIGRIDAEQALEMAVEAVERVNARQK
jgi:ABC-type glycerol-3-phosphate transport system substrate-binding protein